jgi:uncharacterized protein YjbJ (UPF0337 family)
MCASVQNVIVGAVKIAVWCACALFIHLKETEMNWDYIEGNWKQFKGNAKEQWGKLTDDQLDVIAGKRDQLAGRIQETYGITKDAVEQQVTDWQNRLKDTTIHLK